MEDVKPDYMAVTFDLKAPTERHKRYEGYKANRKGMPEELAQQMPMIKEVLKSNEYRYSRKKKGMKVMMFWVLFLVMEKDKA